MNSSDLVQQVSARTGISRDQVRTVLDAIVATTLEQAEQGEEVQIRGLGTIAARWHEPRALRSVQDRQRLVLDGRWVPHFRPATALREALLRRSPQRWKDPRHQAAWRLAETLIGDLDLYHRGQVPQLEPETPLPMVAPICAVAFGPVWDRVINTWNTSVAQDVREEGKQLLHVALHRWRVAGT